MRALAIGGGDPPPGAVPNSNYVVPMDSNSPSCITRPLAEILRDLNKRIPDNIIIKTTVDDHHINNTSAPFIPWLPFLFLYYLDLDWIKFCFII